MLVAQAKTRIQEFCHELTKVSYLYDRRGPCGWAGSVTSPPPHPPPHIGIIYACASWHTNATSKVQQRNYKPGLLNESPGVLIRFRGPLPVGTQRRTCSPECFVSVPCPGPTATHRCSHSRTRPEKATVLLTRACLARVAIYWAPSVTVRQVPCSDPGSSESEVETGVPRHITATRAARTMLAHVHTVQLKTLYRMFKTWGWPKVCRGTCQGRTRCACSLAKFLVLICTWPSILCTSEQWKRRMMKQNLNFCEASSQPHGNGTADIC